MSAFATIVKVMRRGPLMPGPYRTALRHKPTFFGKLAMETWVGAGRAAPQDLKTLAQLRTSSLIGCLW